MRLLEYIDILIADSILYFTKKLMNPIKMRIEFSSNNFSFYDIFLSLQYPSAQFIFIIKSIRLLFHRKQNIFYQLNFIQEFQEALTIQHHLVSSLRCSCHYVWSESYTDAFFVGVFKNVFRCNSNESFSIFFYYFSQPL